jgi:hypothetical protein
MNLTSGGYAYALSVSFKAITIGVSPEASACRLKPIASIKFRVKVAIPHSLGGNDAIYAIFMLSMDLKKNFKNIIRANLPSYTLNNKFYAERMAVKRYSANFSLWLASFLFHICA